MFNVPPAERMHGRPRRDIAEGVVQMVGAEEVTDPKLIEAVAQDLCTSDGLIWENLVRRIGHPLLAEYRKHATVAIAAINASGTHWVAPVDVSDAMYDAGYRAESVITIYDVMRDAYLAKTEETA